MHVVQGTTRTWQHTWQPPTLPPTLPQTLPPPPTLLPPALLLASRSRQERVEAKGLVTPAAPVERDAGGAPVGNEQHCETGGWCGDLGHCNA